MATETRTTMDEKSYINPLNQSLRVFFGEGLRVSLRQPSQAFYFFRTLIWQWEAVRLRSRWKQKGVQVPPIMIFSITNQCNLRCKGCYHHALRSLSEAELNDAKLRNVITEARELGISFVVLAGGEPLVRHEILNITRDFPDILFFMFTNGLLINSEVAGQFRRQRNVVPIVSFEGYREDTDNRRGNGVYERLQATVKLLKSKKVFFGTSLTLTRSNFATVSNNEFIKNLAGQGCKLFFFVEYSPTQKGTEDWVITDEQRASLSRLMSSYRSKFSALFISVPGDEKEFGGCLSAGRGFIHVSAEGNVEPCPFVPYSDTNLRDSSLRDALQSPFLKTIRETQEMSEGKGGCALWENREWVQSLLTVDPANSRCSAPR